MIFFNSPLKKSQKVAFYNLIFFNPVNAGCRVPACASIRLTDTRRLRTLPGTSSGPLCLPCLYPGGISSPTGSRPF